MTEYERLSLGLQAATLRMLAELGDLLGRTPGEPPAGTRRALAEAVGMAREALAEADQTFDVAPAYVATPG